MTLEQILTYSPVPRFQAGQTVIVNPPKYGAHDGYSGPMVVVEVDGRDYLLRRPGPTGDPAGEVWIHEQRIAGVAS
jgi:hypothetical protein